MTIELLPCPHCDSTRLKFGTGHDGYVVESRHVECRDCSARGPSYWRTGLCETDEAAADAWNTRGPMLTALGGYITTEAAKRMMQGPIKSGGISISHVKTSTRPIAVYLKERPFGDK